MKRYIYKIQNNINKKIYIGCTAENKEWFELPRINGAFFTLSPQKDLLKDIKEQGIKAFSYQVLETVEGFEFLDKLIQYIEKYDSIEKGYNVKVKIKSRSGYKSKFNREQLEDIYTKIFKTDKDIFAFSKEIGIKWIEIRKINEGEAYYDPTLQYPINKKFPPSQKTEIKYPVNMISINTNQVIRTFYSIKEIEEVLNTTNSQGKIIKLVYILNNDLDEEYFGFKWKYKKD